MTPLRWMRASCWAVTSAIRTRRPALSRSGGSEAGKRAVATIEATKGVAPHSTECRHPDAPQVANNVELKKSVSMSRMRVTDMCGAPVSTWIARPSVRAVR